MNLLSERDVVKKLGVSRTQIWKWRKIENFPKPKNIGGLKKHVWIESEIEEWIRENLEAA